MPAWGWDVLSALGVVAVVLVVVSAVVVLVLVITMIRRHRKVHQPGVLLRIDHLCGVAD
jgi:hypothetical protein